MNTTEHNKKWSLLIVKIVFRLWLRRRKLLISIFRHVNPPCFIVFFHIHINQPSLRPPVYLLWKGKVETTVYSDTFSVLEFEKCWKTWDFIISFTWKLKQISVNATNMLCNCHTQKNKFKVDNASQTVAASICTFHLLSSNTAKMKFGPENFPHISWMFSSSAAIP